MVMTMDAMGDLGQRELAAFFRAVSELYGAEQAERSAEDWLCELTAREAIPASARDWRRVTIAAAAQLAGRVKRMIRRSL